MVKSFLNSINKLIGGEFYEKEVYSMYGVPSVGKSVYLMEETANFLNEGYRVIWIDTEGGFRGNWSVWTPVFINKFSKMKPDNFHYEKVLDLEGFCSLFGMTVGLEYGKSKMEVTPLKVEEKDSILYREFGKLKGKVAVIVDSFTSPIKLQFTSKVQNFSGRADAESLMLWNLVKFAEKVNGFVILSNHESKNPTDPYHPQGKLRGGDTVKYYSKYIIQFNKPMKKSWANFRQLIAVRTPIAPDNSLAEWVKIDNEGYHDTTQQEVEGTQ